MKGIIYYEYCNTLINSKRYSIINESNKASNIFSMFAGVGKEFAIRDLTNKGYNVDNIEKTTSFKQKYPDRSIDFPNDVKKRSKNCDILFIPYFLGMYNECFKGKNINYTIIYPDRKLKDEYFKRFKKLGFTDKEMENFYNNFDSMIDDIENSNCNKIKLTSKNDYALDHIIKILK